jgi:hypothetical protein
MMCSTDEQQRQESGWNGASALQEPPNLRDVLSTLDGAPGTTRCAKCNRVHSKYQKSLLRAGTTSEMSKRASACGAIPSAIGAEYAEMGRKRRCLT